MHKLIRVTTASMSFKFLIKGQARFLNQFFNVIAVTGDCDYSNEIKEIEGVDCNVIKMKRNISLIKDLISVFKLYIFFRNEKPQIVHSITPKAGLLSMFAAYFAGVPIRVHTYTGLIFPSKSKIKRQILIIAEKLLCYFATNIYSDGNGVKNDLINYRITKKKIKVISKGSIDGLNHDFFNKKLISTKIKKEILSKLNISNNEFIFIYVGRLVKDKGINELVFAFNELSKSYKKTKLIMVGAFENNLDPLNNNTLKLINENKQIVLTGLVNDVRPYFSISNVFVFPTYREGFPITVMEAGSMSLPSIVTDINGCNEIIKNNVNGLIIPSKNVSLLKKKMIELIENQVLYKKISQNARKIIIKNYNQKQIRKTLVEEYSKLLKDLKSQI